MQRARTRRRSATPTAARAEARSKGDAESKANASANAAAGRVARRTPWPTLYLLRSSTAPFFAVFVSMRTMPGLPFAVASRASRSMVAAGLLSDRVVPS